MEIKSKKTMTYTFEDISEEELDVISFAIEEYGNQVDVNSEEYIHVCKVASAFGSIGD